MKICQMADFYRGNDFSIFYFLASKELKNLLGIIFKKKSWIASRSLL